MIIEYLFAFIICTILIITIWYANNMIFENDIYNISNKYTYYDTPNAIDKTPSSIYPKIVLNDINQIGSASASSSSHINTLASIATNIKLINKPSPPPKPSYPKIVINNDNKYIYIDQDLDSIDYNILKDPNPLDLVINNQHPYEYKSDLQNMKIPPSILTNKAQASLVFFEDDTIVKNNGQMVNINMEPIHKYYSTHHPSPPANTVNYSPDNTINMINVTPSGILPNYDNINIPQSTPVTISNTPLTSQDIKTQSDIGKANILKSGTSINPMFVYNSYR